MAQWITNWPVGSRKWASCTPAMAAQIAAEGRCEVRLVKNTIRLSRHVLLTPEFARPRTLGMPASRAVMTALRISPLDRFREERRAAAA